MYYVDIDQHANRCKDRRDNNYYAADGTTTCHRDWKVDELNTTLTRVKDENGNQRL